MRYFFSALTVAFIFIVCCPPTYGDCSGITATQVGDARTYGGVSPNVYVASETVTYLVTCTNGNTGATTYTTENAVTATGQGGWKFNGTLVPNTWIACNPQFGYSLVPSPSTGSSHFTNVGQSNAFTNGNTSGAQCYTPSGPSTNQTLCPSVACAGGGSGGSGEPCPGSSPIILDTNGQGFDLTSAENGVQFDIAGTGAPQQMGWTASGSSNAFLTLPASDGLVHDGKQLFGNFTPQPSSDDPNGFLALAVYDRPENGGNGDGVIDAKDAIFNSLRLWIDSNHDGICQPNELHTLQSLGVNSISLHYTDSSRTDRFGNVFRYKAAVNGDDRGASRVDRKAYDVFFVTPSATTKRQRKIRLLLVALPPNAC